MVRYKHAFSLSRREVQDAVPPGTVTLAAHSQQLAEQSQEALDGELLLVPRPSSDPLDPLNWPLWRKLVILICVSLYAFIGNFTSASIASAFPLYATPLAFNPPKSIGELTHLVAVNVLMMGAANLWWVPLGNTFGRRPIILLNLLLLTFTSMWAGLAKSFGSLLAARVFMGIGVGPSETLAPNMIGEIFFTHQRGRAMGLYTACICLGPIVGAVAGGYIAFNLGLAWIHWVNVILSAILFVACFFLVPETLYARKELPNVRGGASEKPLAKADEETSSQMIENAVELAPANEPSQQLTFLRSLKMFTYQGEIGKKFVAPWLTLRLPGVWLVMLWYAGLVGGIVTISTVGPTLVSQPPYLWGANAGLIMVGGIVGAVLGTLATSLVADRVVTTKYTLKGDRYMEPEARLPIAIPGLFLATTGLWTFGFCAQNPAPHMWVGMQFGLGMLSFGLMQAPSIGFNYIIDSYAPVAADCFVAVTCARAIISFSWTFFTGEWVTTAGPAIPFGVYGGLMGAFSLLVIPQWIWGKRTRIATAKWVPAFN